MSTTTLKAARPALRRLSLLGAATAVAASVLATAPAHATYSNYKTSPYVSACWTKVNAYGGVYQVKNYVKNTSTTAYYTAQVYSYRPGTGYVQQQSYTAGPGQTVYGAVQNVALVPNDSYRVYLNTALVVDIPANGIPYYMQHCDVANSSSAVVRSAVSYGLSKLDAVYVGCAAGTYRFGTVAPSDLNHDGRTCGQSRVYFQPKGSIGYDCSGLVAMMYRTAGVSFPWTSSTSIKDNVPKVSKASIQVGDLLAKYGHVRVYLGDGDGDGVPSFLEATPWQQNSNGSWNGVRIVESSTMLGDADYTAHRVPGV